MISTILATDMQRHFDYMTQLGELKEKLTDNDVAMEDWSDKDKEHTRELLMAILMKAADISNVARPFDVSATWAKILMNEFARQGELEAELDLPTCLFGGPPKSTPGPGVLPMTCHERFSCHSPLRTVPERTRAGVC